MTNTGGVAVKPVFVKVFGFCDEDREALTTALRLPESAEPAQAADTSAARPPTYALWTAHAAEPAQLALVDGDSWEAAVELAHPAHDGLKLVWIGDRAPARASLVFGYPAQWAVVFAGMDALLAASPAPTAAVAAGDLHDDLLDLDLLSEPPLISDVDLDPDVDAQASTEPTPLEPAPPAGERGPVLVVDADRDARLYLRARLAVAGRPQVDEAASAAEALQLINTRLYRLVILSLDLPDMDGWKLVEQVKASRPVIHELLLTGSRISPVDTVRAWFAGARACLRKPLDPRKLTELLGNAP